MVLDWGGLSAVCTIGGAVNRAVHTLIIHDSLLQNALLCMAIIPIQRKKLPRRF